MKNTNWNCSLTCATTAVIGATVVNYIPTTWPCAFWFACAATALFGVAAIRVR